MNSQDSNPRGLSRDVIDRLATQMLDSRLSDDERADLLAGIHENPAACDRFVDHVLLHASLQKELGAYRPATLSESLYGNSPASSPPVNRSLPQPFSAKAARNWNREAGLSLLFLAMGIGFALLGFWLFGQNSSSEQHLTQQAIVDATTDAVTNATPVAYLAVANGCDWGGGEVDSWAVGRTIDVGEELTLFEGTAMFRLSSGVTLNVEGPAALVIASPTSLVIRYGKLTALVPWTVSDFRLLASTCCISARDAEFGVDVNGNSVDVHVFSGEVLATASPFFSRSSFETLADDRRRPDVPGVQPEVIHDGESAFFSSDDRAADAWLRGDADRSRFATKLSMNGRLAVSPQYVESVLRAAPAGYWRFESIRGGQVPNEVEGGLPPLRTLGDVVLAGNASNRVVEFGPHATGALVSADRMDSLAGDEYSVELWAKPSHFHFGMLVTMTTGPENPEDRGQWFNEKHGFMLEAQPGYQCEYGNPGSIRYLHRNPPGSQRAMGVSCYSNSLYGLRRWQHIVAVKRQEMMNLYIDGQLVGEVENDTPLAGSLYLVIGQHLSDNSGLNRFVGQIDELAIYDRALTDQEVREHWQLIELESTDHRASGI